MAVVSKKLMERYQELKAEEQTDILLMQVGAFMQEMNDDAKLVSEITGIKLQMAGDVDAPVIIGGFPKTGLDKYYGQLLRAGKSIAIAVQSDSGSGDTKERHINEVIKVNIEKL